jgi:hypothetical protein
MDELETDNQLSVLDKLVAVPENVLYPSISQIPAIPEDRTSIIDLVKLGFKETTYYSLLNDKLKRESTLEERRNFNFLENVPDDLIEYAGSFSHDTSIEEINETAARIRNEINDKNMIANNPITAFFASIPGQIIDPANFLPGSAIYKYLRRGQIISRAAISSAITGFAASGTQESFLLDSQLTRTPEESLKNMFATTILAGALGGTFAYFKSSPKARAHQEIKNVIGDIDKKLTKDGILTTEDIANFPEPLKKIINFTPMNQLINSDFLAAKKFANIVYEHGYDLVKTLSGETKDTSIESLIKLDKAKYLSRVLEAQNIYLKSIGIEGGPLKDIRAKFANVELTPTKNAEEIYNSIVDGIEPNNKAVKQQVDIFESIFNDISEDLQSNGLLPEGITPKNAVSYLPIVYDKPKIIEQGGREGPIADVIFRNFKNLNEEIKSFKEEPAFKFLDATIKFLKEEIKILSEKKRPPLKKIKIKKEHLISTEVMLKELIPERFLTSKGKLRKVASNKVLLTQARQTVDNILGHKDGSLINPVLEQIMNPKSSPFKSRVLDIPQIELSEWAIRDPYQLLEMHIRATAPINRLTEGARKQGFKNLAEWKEGLAREIKKEFDKKANGLTGKEAVKLEKKFIDAKKNINDSVDILLGIYGVGPNILDGSMAKLYKTILTWNATRLLGYMTISSVPDIGLHVFKNGFFRSISNGLIPVLKSIGKETVAKNDLKSILLGVNTELGSRMKSFIDNDSISVKPSPFSKALDFVSQKFGNLSLMNQWNDFHQNVAGQVSIDRTLSAIDRWIVEGKINNKEIRRLNNLGISKEYAAIIHEKTKNQIDEATGARFADWGNWEIKSDIEAEALDAFQASVITDVDSIVILPGLGDKPRLAQTGLGRLLFQFKSFLLAATNKVFVSGIQRYRDLEVATGIISMLALGGLSYVLTSMIRGTEPDLSFTNLAKESIDRSGILGIYGEVYNIAGKTGLIPWKSTSRYATRNLAGALFGPSFGSLTEIVGVLDKISGFAVGEELTTKDAAKIARLLPMQNLFYLDKLKRKLVYEAALNLGLEDRGE